MANVISTAVDFRDWQSNDQVTRLILLGATGDGMYYFSISFYLEHQTQLRK